MTTKEKVLAILTKEQNKPVSGEFLAEQCGISRAAIWKAVNTLRENGYDIQGTTNGGYILKATNDVFSLENLSLSLARVYPNLKDCHIECFKEIDSTNTYAKKILSENGSFRFPNGALTEAGKKNITIPLLFLNAKLLVEEGLEELFIHRQKQVFIFL